MSAIASTPIDAEAKNAPVAGRLFFPDLIVFIAYRRSGERGIVTKRGGRGYAETNQA